MAMGAFAFLLLGLSYCCLVSAQSNAVTNNNNVDLTSLVNLFIGTASGANGGSGGNGFPGECSFGFSSSSLFVEFHA